MIEVLMGTVIIGGVLIAIFWALAGDTWLVHVMLLVEAAAIGALFMAMVGLPAAEVMAR